MILFMIKKPEKFNDSDRYVIKYECNSGGINKGNAWFVAWNQINYKLDETNNIRVEKIDNLMGVVFHAAEKDPLCQDINHQFNEQYGINIFQIKNNDKNPNYHIIRNVFYSWAHPMIGNIMLSPGVRPQTTSSQYVDNWDSFNYMSPETKSCIKKMIDDPTSVGLKVLEKSGRDQVRVCKDMRELARAIMGEISTYATKKLEKIFALELCASPQLLKAQRQLIVEIIKTKFFDIEIGVAKFTGPLELKTLFFKQREVLLDKSPLSVTEYIDFFFPELTKLSDEMQWTAFVHLINWTLGFKSNLEFIPPVGEEEKLLERCKEEYIKFPPIMQCAMIINGIKRFEKNYFIQRYSMAVCQSVIFKPDQKFVLDCEITEASGRDFVPTLEGKGKNIFLWNWMREETHLATMTYRHYLMPLWAGPSGHAAGLIDFYSRHLLGTGIIVDGKRVSISSIILPTMFTFWRLYYDKRICAVHTLAETFEAGFSYNLRKNEELSIDKKKSINAQIDYEAIWITARDLPKYEDPFDIIRFYPRAIPNTFGVVNSVRIMAQIKKKHYINLESLDKTINDLRQKIATDLKCEIPQWSKPIFIDPKNRIINECTFKSLKIRDFSALNVRTIKQQIIKNNFLREFLPSKRIASLYETISKVTQDYNFSEDFNDLPDCIMKSDLKPFLAGVSFFNIEDCVLEEGALTFRSNASTNAEFWNVVKGIIPMNEVEEFCCMVTDDKEGFNFSGRIKTNSLFKVLDNLSLNVKEVVIKSGLDKNSSFPHIFLISDITHRADTLNLTVTISLVNNLIYIHGEYESGKVLTIPRLLALLGIDKVIDVSSILPDNESVGLRDISLTISTDTLSLLHLDFTIMSEKPLNIYDNKITIQPYFEINIEYPFDDKRRQVDYTILGKWMIKESTFDLMYRSDQVINIKLAEGSVLNFGEIANMFAKNIKFPEIKLTQMELTIDLVSKNYSLDLATKDVLRFKVGEKEVGIDDISFSLDFENNKFSDLSLAGALALGGLSLNLSGVYKADGNFTFEAMAFSDLNYSLQDFAKTIAKDISNGNIPTTFPENFLNVNIRMFKVTYESENNAFQALVSLENVLKISDYFSINEFALKISTSKNTPLEFTIIAQVYICEIAILLSLTKENTDFIIAGEVNLENLTLKNIIEDLGINVEGLPQFIQEFAVEYLNLQYNISKKDFQLILKTSIGTIGFEVIAGNELQWRISYKTNFSVNMLHMPLIGEMIKKLSSDTTDFSVKDFEIEASPNNVIFKCMAFGNDCSLDIYKSNLLIQNESYDNDKAAIPATTKWIELNKTFSILTISKIGIGLDGSKVVLLLDASLNVSPLSFGLTGAGVGINIANPADIAFYLSGFGVSFNNGMLAIGGSFLREQKDGKDTYAGALLIKFKGITATAIGEYSAGSLMAYVAICASIGGPPAFFVTGLAFGFGYNKKITLPQIEDVPKFPLIKAAINGFDMQTLQDLNTYIKDENQQYFLTAGVKFTSFKLVNGFLLLSVSFGKEFEIGVLGIANISIPPEVPTNPIAKAELSLKADFNMAIGTLKVEARLTSESYILSHDCKLMGGFAAYFWFGNHEHRGDFVITLGGYHPAFKKPDHYPIVPRLGLNWNINSHLNLSGEIYFALTPSMVMAGGKLVAMYTHGNLKAWFIAYADFLLSWKPFYYKATIGVSIGASYRVKWWFIDKTFSIELSAKLQIWGPEVQGKVYISWFIISFTISFSKGQDNSEKSLNWKEFKESFLLDTESKKNNDLNGNSDILSISIDGVTNQAQDGIDIIDSNHLFITIISKIPESGHVRPVNSAELKTQINLDIEKDGNLIVNEKFIKNSVNQNIPAAMWKKTSPLIDKLKEGSIVKDAVCGYSFQLNADIVKPELFPKLGYISLEELYKNNTLTFKKCFQFILENRFDLSTDDTITKFIQNSSSKDSINRRKKYLADHGIIENVSISILSEHAENCFSEYILIKN